MPRSRRFFVEDVVTRKESHRQIGVVDRTVEEIETHSPFPGREYPKLDKHASVKESDYRQFLNDGVPPEGCVLVLWGFNSHDFAELIHSKHLKLSDRLLVPGDVVTRPRLEHLSGSVTGAVIKVDLAEHSSGTLRILKNQVPADWRETSKMWELFAQRSEDGNHFVVEFIASERNCVEGIPAHEVIPSRDYLVHDLIEHEGWVGRIEAVERELTLRLLDGSIVSVENGDPGSDDNIMLGDGPSSYFQIGDVVRCKKGNLRRGQWIRGAYNPNLQPFGSVLETKVKCVFVDWLTSKPGCPRTLDERSLRHEITASTLSSGRYRTMAMLHAQAERPRSDLFLTIETGHRVYDKVRFKDGEAAAKKYGLTWIPPSETAGFDVNVYRISHRKQNVHVQWQDLTTSTHSTLDLSPSMAGLDTPDAWPGDLIGTKSGQPFQEGDTQWGFQPEKVGIVQTMDPEERMVHVRWAKEHSVRFVDGDGGPLLPGATIGDLLPETAVSIYDVQKMTGLRRIRGDHVVVYGDDLPPDSWLGQVVDVGLDGMLTVRLELVQPMQEVRVPPQRTSVIQSMGPDDPFEHDSDVMSEDEGDIAATFRHVEATHPEFHSALDVLRGAFGLPARFSAQTTGGDTVMGGTEIEGVEGEIVMEDGDDAWETDDGGDDDSDEYLSAEEGHHEEDASVSQNRSSTIVHDHAGRDLGPNTNTLATADDSDITKEDAFEVATGPLATATIIEPLNLFSLENCPPPYDIIESIIPDDHAFKSTEISTANATRTRRIQKEHKILRKSLPDGIFVRTWASRMDLLRVMLIGPLGTPYELAPFIIDVHLHSTFPREPPDVHFHSWTDGSGSINPNLYEDGKICLSLLGTWSGDRPGESWNPSTSTVLQLFVSILGLVLVRDPYFNEAGYEARTGMPEARLPAALYSERVYFRSRNFILSALLHGAPGFNNVIRWLYALPENEGGAGLLARAITLARATIVSSRDSNDNSPRDGLRRCTQGATLMLEREVHKMEDLRNAPIAWIDRMMIDPSMTLEKLKDMAKANSEGQQHPMEGPSSPLLQRRTSDSEDVVNGKST